MRLCSSFKRDTNVKQLKNKWENYLLRVGGAEVAEWYRKNPELQTQDSSRLLFKEHY